MTELLRKKLRESAAARWTVLVLVSFAMLTGYLISDIMSPLDTLLETQEGWTKSDFGTFNFGYGIFNVFLLMLIFAGMILDRFGPRVTGVLAIVLMLAGTAVKYWALSTDFAGAEVSLFGSSLLTWKAQVFWAMSGFAIFGVGIEMIGITATKIVVKWFTGHQIALALGLNVAFGRIGTGIALLGSLPYAKYMGAVSAPLAMGLLLLVIGLLAFLVFAMIDRKADAQTGDSYNVDPADRFKISDIFLIVKLRGFWYITLLCLLFYSAVFPFIKFATGFMIQKYDAPTSWAGALVALITFGNILLTPLFGSVYDRKGRGATMMLIGSLMLVAVHALFAIPILHSTWMPVVLMLTLGAAFSLVPSAMWPSVPKIIPFKLLGTAYGLIFWVQNVGLMCVPKLIGWVLDKYCIVGTTEVDGQATTLYDYSLPMVIFAAFGVVAVLFALLLRREDARKHYGLELPNIKSLS